MYKHEVKTRFPNLVQGKTPIIIDDIDGYWIVGDGIIYGFAETESEAYHKLNKITKNEARKRNL